MKDKLLKKTEKQLKKWKKETFKEKRRCKKSYPDWTDTDDNFLDLKYIFGVCEDLTIARNFIPLTILEVVYDRQSKKYYLNYYPEYPEDLIIKAFITYIQYYRQMFPKEKNNMTLQKINGDIFSAESELELFQKIDWFLAGYCEISQ